MTMYSNIEELHADYEKRFGEDWERCELEDEDHWMWIMACYDLYAKVGEFRPTFESNSGDIAEYNGGKFEIVEPITDDQDWGLVALPAYRIRIEGREGVLDAYPDEIFLNA